MLYNKPTQEPARIRLPVSCRLFYSTFHSTFELKDGRKRGIHYKNSTDSTLRSTFWLKDGTKRGMRVKIG